MPKSFSFLGRRSPKIERLEPRLVLDASALLITEFVASNENSLVDFEGDSPDWIELHNPSANPIDLTGLYLTDDDDDLPKWEFPVGTSLEGGGYLIVFASDKDTVMPNGELHTNFRLSAGGEYLGLIDSSGNTALQEFSPEYPQQEEDVAYGLAMQPTGASEVLVASDAQARAWLPTSSVFDTTWTDPDFNDVAFNIVGSASMGYENSPGDTINYTSLIDTPVSSGLSSLYMRVPFTLTTLAGIDRLSLQMKYDDGFVAYLNGEPVAMANEPEGIQWNATAGANHDDFEAIDFKSFDVSFAIPNLVVGENVLAIHCMNVSTTSSDFLIVPQLVAVESEVLSPAALGYFDVPTPGYANGESFAGFADEAQFSVPHGFYNTPQQVAITSSTPGATIVYTTNNSTPAVDQNLNITNGTLYTGPVTIADTTSLRAAVFKPDFRPALTTTATYIFLDDVVDQSPLGQTPAGFAPNGTNGQEISYGIDPNILNLYGEQALKDSLLSIPTIALTTDLANLFDPQTGIYVNATQRGRDWERFSSVELINPDGSEGFSTNAGLRIRGGFGRNDFNPKHAFRLYFRGEYGDGLLDFPLFDEEGTDRFDVLDLRTASNYSWSSQGDAQNTFVREVFARDMQADLGQPYTRSRYYHLYLDGQYWGLFQTQERIQEHYGESYFGGDESDYDVVKSDLAVSGGTELADGNDLAWRALFDYAQQLADNPFSQANNYWAMQGLNPDGTRNELLPVLLDVENLIDYMLVIFYTGGYDTGISLFLGNQKANNWFGIYNRETADTGFQFFIHDNEHSLAAAGNTHGTFGIDRTGPFFSSNDRLFSQFNPQFLHQDLLAHPEYLQLFIDRVQRAMFNDGPLTIQNNLERFLKRQAEVDPAIIAEAARWGDSKREPAFDKSDWENEVDWITDNYFTGRQNIVLDQLRGDRLFSTFDAPSFSQHGGEVPTGYSLLISGSGGTIYYTTDGETDPRAIGGAVNSDPAVKVYSGSLSIHKDTTVKARLRTPRGEWSGLVEASFDVPRPAGDYNSDGSVDTADYQTWKLLYGLTVDEGLAADGNGNGVIDAGDYTVWRDALASANSAASETSQAVVQNDIASNTSVGSAVRTFTAAQVYAAAFDGSTTQSPSASPVGNEGAIHTHEDDSDTLLLLAQHAAKSSDRDDSVSQLFERYTDLGEEQAEDLPTSFVRTLRKVDKLG